MKRTLKTVSAAAAVAVVLFVGGINVSPALAAGLETVPVLGKLVNVLSIRTYTEKTDDLEVTVNQPAVDLEDANTVDLNGAIEQTVYAYVRDAERRIAEYKQAFLATGGTDAEFAQKDIKVSVDYEILSQSDRYLSFVLKMDENWVDAYNQRLYYTLDAKTGQPVSLEDLLGEDYVQIANEAIDSQIQARNAALGENTYFPPQQGGFETIDETTKFYVNEAGNAVVVFEKFEVAVGTEGMPEFEITQS